MSRRAYETPPKKPRYRDIATPTAWQLANTLPSIKWLQKTVSLTRVNPDLGKTVLKALRALYYPVTDRRGIPDSTSLQSALTREVNDKKPTRQTFHHIKAAYTWHQLKKTVGELNQALSLCIRRKDTTTSKHEKDTILKDMTTIQEFIDYFIIQQNALLEQLHQLTDDHLKAVEKFFNGALPQAAPKTEKQRQQIMNWHPEKIATTPCKTLTDKSKEIREIITEINETIEAICRGERSPYKSPKNESPKPKKNCSNQENSGKKQKTAPRAKRKLEVSPKKNPYQVEAPPQNKDSDGPPVLKLEDGGLFNARKTKVCKTHISFEFNSQKKSNTPNTLGKSHWLFSGISGTKISPKPESQDTHEDQQQTTKLCPSQ